MATLPSEQLGFEKSPPHLDGSFWNGAVRLFNSPKAQRRSFCVCVLLGVGFDFFVIFVATALREMHGTHPHDGRKGNREVLRECAQLTP